MAMEHNQLDLRHIYDLCFEKEHFLNEWEQEFLYSIRRCENLTVKQYRKLLILHAKILEKMVEEEEITSKMK